MSLLDDIIKLFDRWDDGRRMREAPSRIDALEKRVAELEQKLGGKYPPNVCRFCGERAARLTFSQAADKSMNKEHWTCGECGKVDAVLSKPTTR